MENLHYKLVIFLRPLLQISIYFQIFRWTFRLFPILPISMFEIYRVENTIFDGQSKTLNVGSKGINYFLQSNEITLLNFPNKFLPPRLLENRKLNIPQL